MAQALTHIRAAGLSVGLTDDLRLIVRPSSLITPELREFAKAHRDELIACLLAEQAVPPPAPALSRAEWAVLDKAYQSHHPQRLHGPDRPPAQKRTSRWPSA